MKPVPRIRTALTAMVAAGWVAHALGAGRGLASLIAARAGDKLLALGDGKFTDAEAFVRHRLFETLWITTASLLLYLGLIGLHTILRRKNRPILYWVGLSVYTWAALNLVLGLAMQTFLFWGLMWDTRAPHNLVQFHAKNILHAEHPGPSRAVLFGSSQIRAQIDENLLNRLMAGKLWTTELHFPGSKAYDLLLSLNRLKAPPPEPHHLLPQRIQLLQRDQVRRHGLLLHLVRPATTRSHESGNQRPVAQPENSLRPVR